MMHRDSDGWLSLNVRHAPAVIRPTQPLQRRSMIRSFVSLAALATLATGAAAQTSSTTVTIYGLVDLSVQHLRSGDRSPFAGQNQTRLADGVIYGPGSRWGLRVSEDLGGGLSARALL